MSSFTPPAALNPLTKARSVDINNLSDAVATAFAALPSDADLNNGTVNFGTDSGTANTYVVTLPRTPTGYVDGLRVVFTPLFSNTGASTVNVNGLGVKAIRLQDNTVTEPGTLVAGIPKTLIYGAALGNFFVEANSVTSAMTAAAAAAASAGAAAGSASAAATSASNAATSEANAQDYALAAQGTQVIGTSTSSVAIGTGNKTFVTQAAKQFALNVPIIAVDQANPANYMSGTVLSYSGTSLQIAVTAIGGSGTISAWNISISGIQGIQGPAGNLSGGNLTNALNELKGTAPASSATPDIWNAGGNYVPITQTAAITGLPNAPQAGATRTLQVVNGFPITSSANFFVHGGSTVLNPGDELDIVADTVSKFLVTVRRNNGAFNSMNGRAFQLLKNSGTWTAPTTGYYTIILVGACGSGAVAIAASSGRAAASGGSTGGIVVKTFYATAGDTFTLVFGSRGIAISVTITGNSATNGNDAGDSTFAGGSISLTAGGGKKGNATVVTSATASAFAAGAVGGSASGGDYNFTGSPSGSVTATATAGTPGLAAASGGAASPYKGSSNKSGDVILSSSGSNYVAASGGAGHGGKSGDVSSTDSATASAGASALFASANVSGGTVGTAPAQDADFSAVLSAVPLTLNGTGTNAALNASTTNSGAGAGSGAIIDTATGTYASGAVSLLGGSGAAAGFSATSGNNLTSGSVNFGGSSGGVALASGAIINMTGISGNSGQAYALISLP